MASNGKNKMILSISIAAVALIAIVCVVFFFVNRSGNKKTNNGGQDMEEPLVKKDLLNHDEGKKIVTYEGTRYTIKISYDKQFRISELILRNQNILEDTHGICTGLLVRGAGDVEKDQYYLDHFTFTSLQLETSPEIVYNEEARTAVFTYSGPYTTETVSFHFTSDFAEVSFERTFTQDVTLLSQAFPSIHLKEHAVENIRWQRSGGNYWIDGFGGNMYNFLSGGEAYLKFGDGTGGRNGNIRRAMEDVSFTLLSSPENNFAVSFTGTVAGRDDRARGYATAVQRYEAGDTRPLEMNVLLSAPDRDLRYVGATDGWGSYNGRTAHQGYQIYNRVDGNTGNTDKVTYIIRPENYDDYFDLGTLNGVNEALISQALNHYGRLMIMDYDMGTTVENPNHFFELPALEQHWNTNLLSLLGDDQALETQKNGMRVIRDKLQAKDGHIMSPYPQSGGDSWGSQYSDMMPGYVISVIDLYALTGDRAFLDEMYDSIEKAMESQQKRYMNGDLYLCRLLNTTDKFNMNDYWEHTQGEYNGYTSAMYYHALQYMAEIEQNVYKNLEKSADYAALAEKIKKDFNEKMWSEATQTFLYGDGNLDVMYLPVQGAALKTDLVTKIRAQQIVQAVERATAVFDLPFHVMNVLDLQFKNEPASQSYDHTLSMLGMNGGWYGAPDGDFYAGFPAYGDRTLIPKYLNGFTDVFSKHGFVGATCFMRDGVTPADYGWYDSMPTLAYPIWGLYTYGYGFQPRYDSLQISPFIHESMTGSVVKYRWRSADMTVTYETLYSFTLEIKTLPADIYFNFINQSPQYTYQVSVNGEVQEIKADEKGTVTVKVPGSGKTAVALLNPDAENAYDSSANLALNKPVAASSTYYGNSTTEYWSWLMTDGESSSGCWKPESSDEKPWIRLALGRACDVGTIQYFVEGAGTYYYTIEGTNDPSFQKWTALADRTKDGAEASKENPITEDLTGKGEYHYLRITFHKIQSSPTIRISEICTGK